MKKVLPPLTRRSFLQGCAAGASLILLPGSGCSSTTPAFLGPQERKQFAADPRAARLAWFTQAKFGLFIHYGLYSQLGRGEWVMHSENIPVAQYIKLKDTFTAKDFDADAICDLAVAAGMKYVTMTAKHHDGFCLFRTAQTDYNSVNSPAKRDIIGEMIDACRRRKLGFFPYYSYGVDWKHPYFCPRSKEFRSARPYYKEPEPTYLFRKDEDFRKYIDFAHAQLRELLTQYGPLAGIWFDPLMAYYARPDLFPIDETYAMVRSLQPGCLISYKQGASGTEDFVAPERAAKRTHKGELAERVWEMNKNKPAEICDTLQPRKWGYVKAADGQHKTDDDVMDMLGNAAKQNANLLLNIGPLPDGGVHPEDIATLRKVGKRLGVTT